MEHTSKDLRVKRTIRSVRRAFDELILEKKFEEISITELSERAEINRKTFYLHYSSLDDLLKERQDEIVERFLEYVQKETSDLDVAGCINKFYHYLAECDEVEQKLLCDSDYGFFYENVTNAMLQSPSFMRFYERTEHPELVRAYSVAISTIFRAWLQSDRSMPLDDLIAYTGKLLNEGYNGVKRH